MTGSQDQRNSKNRFLRTVGTGRIPSMVETCTFLY